MACRPIMQGGGQVGFACGRTQRPQNWRVINNWAGYATGGVIVAVVSLWFGLRELSIPRRIGLIMAGVFLFLAIYRAWRDEHLSALNAESKLAALTKPDLSCEVHQLIVGKNSNGWVNIVAIITIVNRGAPSIAEIGPLVLHTPKGDFLGVENMRSSGDTKLAGAPGQPDTILLSSDHLTERAMNSPIPNGGATYGWINSYFPSVTLDDLKNNGEDAVSIKILDVNKKEYASNMHHITFRVF